jgi:hypothetical protein
MLLYQSLALLILALSQIYHNKWEFKFGNSSLSPRPAFFFGAPLPTGGPTVWSPIGTGIADQDEKTKALVSNDIFSYARKISRETCGTKVTYRRNEGRHL